jgi:hypothetical protein
MNNSKSNRQGIFKINATQTNRGKLNSFDLNKMLVLCKDTNPQVTEMLMMLKNIVH